jgi:hypothetical protein
MRDLPAARQDFGRERLSRLAQCFSHRRLLPTRVAHIKLEWELVTSSTVAIITTAPSAFCSSWAAFAAAIGGWLPAGISSSTR